MSNAHVFDPLPLVLVPGGFNLFFLQVALTKDSSENEKSVTEYGVLSLDGTSLMFAAKKPKKLWTTIKLSAVGSVTAEPQATPGQENACRVLVRILHACRGHSPASATSGHRFEPLQL